MNLQQELQKRIFRIIRDTIKPPILVSDRWFAPAGGKAVLFSGSIKMGKATGKNAHYAAKLLLKQLDVRDLGVKPEIRDDGSILFAPPRAEKAPAAEAPPAATTTPTAPAQPTPREPKPQARQKVPRPRRTKAEGAAKRSPRTGDDT